MKILGFAGWSGSGKTTLILELIPEFHRLGLSVSTVKRAHHDFDIDQPGKDSYRHRKAGAREVMVSSGKRWALIHELDGEEEPTLADLVAPMSPVDLLLVEGFKHSAHPKLEVYRAELGKPMLWPNDPDVFAIASDAPLDGAPIPTLALNDPPAIARFALDALQIAPKA